MSPKVDRCCNCLQARWIWVEVEDKRSGRNATKKYCKECSDRLAIGSSELKNTPSETEKKPLRTLPTQRQIVDAIALYLAKGKPFSMQDVIDHVGTNRTTLRRKYPKLSEYLSKVVRENADALREKAVDEAIAFYQKKGGAFTIVQVCSMAGIEVSSLRQNHKALNQKIKNATIQSQKWKRTIGVGERGVSPIMHEYKKTTNPVKLGA